jgi:hypothetical protein
VEPLLIQMDQAVMIGVDEEFGLIAKYSFS